MNDTGSGRRSRRHPEATSRHLGPAGSTGDRDRRAWGLPPEHTGSSGSGGTPLGRHRDGSQRVRGARGIALPYAPRRRAQGNPHPRPWPDARRRERTGGRRRQVHPRGQLRATIAGRPGSAAARYPRSSCLQARRRAAPAATYGGARTADRSRTSPPPRARGGSARDRGAGLTTCRRGPRGRPGRRRAGPAARRRRLPFRDREGRSLDAHLERPEPVCVRSGGRRHQAPRRPASRGRRGPARRGGHTRHDASAAEPASRRVSPTRIARSERVHGAARAPTAPTRRPRTDPRTRGPPRSAPADRARTPS